MSDANPWDDPKMNPAERLLQGKWAHRRDGKPRRWGRLALFTLIGVVLLSFVATGLRDVDSHERAVVFHANGSLTILEPGKFQWVTPVLNTVTLYDVRSQTFTQTADGISLDLQLVSTEVTVLYHPEVTKIETIHQTLGPEYARKVVQPSVQDAVKSAVSRYLAEELTGSTREQVKQDLVDRITSDLARQNLVADKVSITDFDFSPEFNAATEAKVVAQQRALEERNRLEQIKYQANQTVIQAQAQAEAARILALTTQGEQGESYLFLQWLQRWDGHLPEVLAGADAQLLLPTPPRSG